jgi:hypothetical protein
MITKLKIPLLFSFLVAFGLLIILTACDDDYETLTEPLGNNQKLRIEVHQVEHTLNENPFLKRILGYVKNKNKQNRLLSTTYNFSIEEELVQILTGDDYIQYTFEVERENPQENVLENYVCKIMNNGLVYQYIIQYPYTLVNGNKNYIASQTHIIPIENPDFVNTTSFRINCPPGSVPYLVDTSEQEICYSVSCGTGEHNYGDDSCRCGKTVNCTPASLSCSTTTVYNWSCGGGGGAGDGNTGDLGTGGGSGTTDNSDSTTTTTVPFETNMTNKEPCEKIKNNTNSPVYKQKFKDLTANYNLANETGFFQKTISGVDQYIDGITSSTNTVTVPPDSKNGTHVHQNLPKVSPNGTAYDGRVKILSVGDLSILIKRFQLNNTNPKDAFLVMLSDEAIYSITILEPIAIDAILEQKLLEFEIEYDAKAKAIISGFYSVESRNKYLQKMFLKGIKKMGLENKIGFFEGTIENETATDINDYKINWERKKLKDTFLGVSVEAIPCNN